MREPSPAEKALSDALVDYLEENPARLPQVISETLKERGVRLLGVFIGLGGHPEYPHVVATVTLDDVTAQTVTQVVTPILSRVWLPPDAIPVMAGTAGAVVSRWLASQRQKAQQRAGAAASGGAGASAAAPDGWSTDESGTDPSRWNKPPQWDPRRRR